MHTVMCEIDGWWAAAVCTGDSAQSSVMTQGVGWREGGARGREMCKNTADSRCVQLKLTAL